MLSIIQDKKLDIQTLDIAKLSELFANKYDMHKIKPSEAADDFDFEEYAQSEDREQQLRFLNVKRGLSLLVAYNVTSYGVRQIQDEQLSEENKQALLNMMQEFFRANLAKDSAKIEEYKKQILSFLNDNEEAFKNGVNNYITSFISCAARWNIAQNIDCVLVDAKFPKAKKKATQNNTTSNQIKRANNVQDKQYTDFSEALDSFINDINTLTAFVLSIYPQHTKFKQEMRKQYASSTSEELKDSKVLNKCNKEFQRLLEKDNKLLPTQKSDLINLVKAYLIALDSLNMENIKSATFNILNVSSSFNISLKLKKMLVWWLIEEKGNINK